MPRPVRKVDFRWYVQVKAKGRWLTEGTARSQEAAWLFATRLMHSWGMEVVRVCDITTNTTLTYLEYLQGERL